MEWLAVAPSRPDSAALERAAAVLRSGGIAVYPTDTLYGLAVDPRLEAAVRHVYAVKRRPPGEALPLVAADRRQAEAVASWSALARRLADRFWPGPLTLLGDVLPGLAPGVDGGTGAVAVRVPDHEVARGLAGALGFPVTSTSANRSGSRAAETARDAMAGLGEEGEEIALVLDAGPAPGGAPSTIVDARQDPPRLIRAGAVPFDRILRALA